MAELLNYPGWLNMVNECLSLLSLGLFVAADFDYPWIEAHMEGKSPLEAAHEALAADEFIVEALPSPAMISAAACTRSVGVE